MIKMTLEDEAAVTTAIKGLSEILSAKGFRDLTLNNVLPYLRRQTRKTFNTETDPGGTAWARLTEATERIREFHGYPPAHPINVRTKAMRSFILGTFDLSGVVSPGQHSVRLIYPQTNFPSGDMLNKITHAQRGGVVNGRPFPARPVIGYGPNDQDVILAMAGRWFIRMFKDLRP